MNERRGIREVQASFFWGSKTPAEIQALKNSGALKEGDQIFDTESKRIDLYDGEEIQSTPAGSIEGYSNIALNSLFGKWADGVSSPPNDWAIEADVTVSRQDADWDKSRGAYCVRITRTGAGSFGSITQVLSAPIYIPKSGERKFRASVIARSSSPGIGQLVYNNGVEDIVIGTMSESNPQRLTGIITVSSTASSFNIALRNTGDTDAWVEFSELSIYEGPGDKAWSPNPASDAQYYSE